MHSVKNIQLTMFNVNFTLQLSFNEGIAATTAFQKTDQDLFNQEEKIEAQRLTNREINMKMINKSQIGCLDANGKLIDWCFSVLEIMFWKCSASKIWIVSTHLIFMKAFLLNSFRHLCPTQND